MTAISETTAAAVHGGGDETWRRRPLREVLRLVRNEPLWFVLTLLSGLGQQAFTAGAVALGGWLVGSVVVGIPTGDLTGAVVAMALCGVAAPICTWATQTAGHEFAFRILARLRIGVYDGLERVAPGYLLGQRTGDLASTAMDDVEVLELFYAHTVISYLIAGAMTLGATITLAVLVNASAAAILVVTALLLATVPFWLGVRAARQGEQLRAELGTLNADVVDGLQGLRELVVFGQGQAYLARLRDRTRRLQRGQLAYGRRAGLERAAGDGIVSLGILATLITLAAQAGDGSLSLRYLPVAVTLVATALIPVGEVNEVARMLGQIRAAAVRVLAISRRRPNVVDLVQAPPAGPVEPVVSFRDVRFRYDEDGPEVLRGASFEIAPGETVALVGASGAGKTTCANLLLRFWDTTSGAVCIGGHDLRAFPQAALRDLVTVVPQDVYLFHGTVADNIRLAKADATDAEVEAAARAANAHEFVERLPDGYGTQVGERGAQLSGGQRQRIAIARAFLKQAPILVMDEAVSNLDTESEALLAAAVREVSRDRTTMIVAHRLSTIRSADRIVVLDDGVVAESGTHEELVAAGGAYARLVAAQRDGFIAVEEEAEAP